MPRDSLSGNPDIRAAHVPPNSEEAEKGVLGSILLDARRVMDICIENQITPESFYQPAHRILYEAMLDLAREGEGTAIDAVTLTDRLRSHGKLDTVGGAVFLDRLVDSTPTSAHAEYYIDIVRQKHLLRSIIQTARDAERQCRDSEEGADMILGKVEQAFMDITESRHGMVKPWDRAVKEAMEHVESILRTRKGLTGISTGFANLDRKIQGLRPGEMVVLAARPSMGKTSLAMNIAEHVALGNLDPDRVQRPVGIFSLEMSHSALVLRMLCSHASVSLYALTSGGYVSATTDHGKLAQAASALTKAPIFLDDTGGLDIHELRARARRMRTKNKVEVVIVDYLQLVRSGETARQGKQIETADVSGNLKAMAKELRVPVLVVSQLSRAPEQRDQSKPKLSDLRDSGAIEQDADVVCFLRRPCIYGETEDRTLAVLDVAKHRNGPTGEVELNFMEEYTRFLDRIRGVDEEAAAAAGAEEEEGAGEERA